jgi:probable rRNA maturation factor
MNRVFFSSEEIPLPPWTKAAGSFIKSVLRKLNLKNWELSVLFCNNEYIRSLNAQYRNKDEATDVLSFPIGETGPLGQYLAGDIVVSLDALEENSRYFNVTKDEELRRLLIHGILHLSGGDHVTNKIKEPMLREQEALLAGLTEKVI